MSRPAAATGAFTMPRVKKDRAPTRYEGFTKPETNYFRVPNAWIDLSAEIDNLAELKVVQYILRHTWGYQEFDIKKHITVDEFVRGRKRQDGTRMDKGTGLSERAVRYGLITWSGTVETQLAGGVRGGGDGTCVVLPGPRISSAAREQLPPGMVHQLAVRG